MAWRNCSTMVRCLGGIGYLGVSIEDAAHGRVRPRSAFLGGYVSQRQFSGNLPQREAGSPQLVHQFDGLLLDYVRHQRLAIGSATNRLPERVVLFVATKDDWKWLVTPEILIEYMSILGVLNSSWISKRLKSGPL